MKGNLDAIETNEKRNAVIEKDVLRFQQREAVLKKVSFDLHGVRTIYFETNLFILSACSLNFLQFGSFMPSMLWPRTSTTQLKNRAENALAWYNRFSLKSSH